MTYEGDNTVMAQQTAKDLVKNLTRAMKGKPTSPYTWYLQQMKTLLAKKARLADEQDLTVDKIQEVLAVRACSAVSRVGKAMFKLGKSGVKQLSILNDHLQTDLIQASKYHSELFVFQSFATELGRALAQGDIEPAVGKHMRRLLRLAGLKMILGDGAKELYICGYFSGKEGPIVERALKTEIAAVRPVALCLLQGLGHRDYFLNSAIG